MILGYVRVSTDGQSIAAQVRQLRAAGAGNVFRETASGAKTDRAQRRRVLAEVSSGDVLMVTRLDRLARSTREPVEHARGDHREESGFPILADAWADTTTAHGRLMLTVLEGLAEFEREPIRARTSEAARAKANGQSLGRKPKLTPHQKQKATRRRDDGEPLGSTARSYNVSASAISRLTACGVLRSRVFHSEVSEVDCSTA